VEIFDDLPLSSLVDNTILCMHGGLSSHVSSVDDIRIIDRKQEIPCEGSMCDILWSDPEPCKPNNLAI